MPSSPRGDVEQRLARQRFHRPGAAIGAEADGVRVPAARVEAGLRHLVGRPHEHVHGDVGVRALRIGAVVEAVVGMRGEQLAVLVEGDADGHLLLARLVGGDQILPPILDPLERAAEQHARRR